MAAKDIYNRIGQILASIAEPDAEKMVFLAQIYPNTEQGGPHWVRKDGTIGRYTKGMEYPEEASFDIINLLHDLRKEPPFSQESKPFNHARIEFDRNGNFSIDFAHIPQEQSWPGVYMVPLGEIARGDLPGGVPVEHWQICKALLEGEITREEFEAERARQERAFDARQVLKGSDG